MENKKSHKIFSLQLETVKLKDEFNKTGKIVTSSFFSITTKNNLKKHLCANSLLKKKINSNGYGWILFKTDGQRYFA